MSQYQKLLDDNLDIFRDITLRSLCANDDENDSISKKPKNVVSRKTLDNLSINTLASQRSFFEKRSTKNTVGQTFLVDTENYVNSCKNADIRDGNVEGGPVPSSLIQQTNVANYQKLLDDDLDIFENLASNKNDKFLELLCSIQKSKKEDNSKLLEEEKEYEFKYVVEKHKDEHSMQIALAKSDSVNDAIVSKSSTTNIVDKNNTCLKTNKNPIFPNFERKVSSDEQRNSVTSKSNDFLEFLCSIQQNHEENSLHQQEYKFKYVVEKKSGGQVSEGKYKDECTVDNNKSKSSHFNKDTNVSKYQKLLDDEKIFEVLHSWKNDYENVRNFSERNMKYEAKLVQKIQSKNESEKQENLIEENSKSKTLCEPSLNVEKNPTTEVLPTAFSNNSYFEVPNDTEYTFKFVRERNKKYEDISEKQKHLITHHENVSIPSHLSMLNVRCKESNIDGGDQKCNSLPENDSKKNVNSLIHTTGISNTCYLKRNQDQGDHIFKRINIPRNKEIVSEQYVNASNSKNFSDFIGISKKNINKQSQGNCQNVTDNYLLSNISQTKKFSLLRDKHNRFQSRNDENIYKLKNCKEKNIFCKRKNKSQSKKPKLRTECELLLKHSVKNYYGVSKSLVENPKKRNTPTCEQRKYLGDSYLCNHYRSPHKYDLNIESVVDNSSEYIKQNSDTSRHELERKSHGYLQLSKSSQEVSQTPNTNNIHKEFCSKHFRLLKNVSNFSLNNVQPVDFSSTRKESVCKSLDSLRKEENNIYNGIQESTNLPQQVGNIPNSYLNCNKHLPNNYSEVFQLPIEYSKNAQDTLDQFCRKKSEHVKHDNEAFRQELKRKLSNSQVSTSQESFQTLNVDNRNEKRSIDNDIQKCNSAKRNSLECNSDSSKTCSEVSQLPMKYIENSQDNLDYYEDSNNTEHIQQSNDVSRRELKRRLTNLSNSDSQLLRISQETLGTPNIDNNNRILERSIDHNIQKCNNLLEHAIKKRKNSLDGDTDFSNIYSEVFQLPIEHLENSQDKSDYIGDSINSKHIKQIRDISRQKLEERKLSNLSNDYSQLSNISQELDNANKEVCSKHTQIYREITNSSVNIYTEKFSQAQKGAASKSFTNLHLGNNSNSEEWSSDNIQKSNNLISCDTQGSENSLSSNTDVPNIYSEDFQLPNEYIGIKKDKLGHHSNRNCVTQNFCEINKSYKKNKTQSQMIKKAKLNLKSCSNNTSISAYYKATKKSVEKSYMEDICKTKNNIENVDTQVLVNSLNFEDHNESNNKNHQQYNNIAREYEVASLLNSTSQMQEASFLVLSDITNSNEQGSSKTDAVFYTNNDLTPNFEDRNLENIKAKKYVVEDSQSVMHLHNYPFSSQTGILTSKEPNFNDAKVSNSNTFVGEDSDRTHKSVNGNANRHILKEVFSQDLSNSNNENAFHATKINYHTKIEYLKDFIEDKLRNIKDYLCRCQNKSNTDAYGGNYINKIILNSLDDASEETLLDELQSQELFSQSLIFSPVLIEYANMKSSQSDRNTNNKSGMSEDQNLKKAIDDLSGNKSLVCQDDNHMLVPERIKNIFILQKISDVFSKLLDDIKNHRVPVIQIRDQANWQNCCFKNNLLVLKPIGKTKNIRIKPRKGLSTSKFDLIVYIIGKITDLLINNKTCTKRELYYQIVKFIKHQVQVNNAVDSISCLLDEPPWDFGILATNKGLVYGDLTIILSENEVITCNIRGGSLIPQNQNKITKFVSNASFILIVEKDSIFQKLLDEDLPNALPRTFIMITVLQRSIHQRLFFHIFTFIFKGKGFADVSTRLFIKKLWQVLKIPVLALVDADPYGIEIILTYRFGSLRLSHLSEYLALPSLRWIGIHPKEIIGLDISHQPLTVRDTRKIQELLKRPYINSVPKIKLELETMLAKNFKAEIEGVMKSDNYLKDFYIPRKLYAQEYF